MNAPIWVLGTELRSFVIAVHTLYLDSSLHNPPPPRPEQMFLSPRYAVSIATLSRRLQSFILPAKGKTGASTVP